MRLLSPMQSCFPAEVRMQVVSLPAEMAVATTPGPKLTDMGVRELVVWPIWPTAAPFASTAAPQQATAPAAERAHTWERPAARETAGPKPEGRV